MVKTKLLKKLIAAVSVIALFGLASCAGADEGGSSANSQFAKKGERGTWEGKACVCVYSTDDSSGGSSSNVVSAASRAAGETETKSDGLTDTQTDIVVEEYFTKQYFNTMLGKVGINNYKVLWEYKNSFWSTDSTGRVKFRDTFIIVKKDNETNKQIKIAQFEQIWDSENLFDMFKNYDPTNAYVGSLDLNSATVAQKGEAFKNIGEYKLRTEYSPSEYKIITYPKDISTKRTIHNHYKYIDNSGEIAQTQPYYVSTSDYRGFRKYGTKETQTYIYEDYKDDGKSEWKLSLPDLGDTFYFITCVDKDDVRTINLETKGNMKVNGGSSAENYRTTLIFNNEKFLRIFKNGESTETSVNTAAALSTTDLSALENYIYVSERKETVNGVSVPSFIRIKTDLPEGADFTGDYLNVVLVPVVKDSKIVYDIKTTDGVPEFCAKYYEVAADITGYANKASDWFKAEYCPNCGTEYKTVEEADKCSKQPGCPDYTMARETIAAGTGYDFTTLKFADLISAPLAKRVGDVYTDASEMTWQQYYDYVYNDNPSYKNLYFYITDLENGSSFDVKGVALWGKKKNKFNVLFKESSETVEGVKHIKPTDQVRSIQFAGGSFEDKPYTLYKTGDVVDTTDLLSYMKIRPTSAGSVTITFGLSQNSDNDDTNLPYMMLLDKDCKVLGVETFEESSGNTQKTLTVNVDKAEDIFLIYIKNTKSKPVLINSIAFTPAE